MAIMTVALDAVVRVDGVAFAAIVERSIQSGARGAVWFRGVKRPVAILINRDGETTAFEIDGAPITLEELEQRFPGRRAEFERLADTST